MGAVQEKAILGLKSAERIAIVRDKNVSHLCRQKINVCSPARMINSPERKHIITQVSRVLA